MGKIRSWQNTLPYLSDKARNLELAGTPRNNKRPACREEELISALHQLPPPPPPPQKEADKKSINYYFLFALSASLNTDQ